MGKVYQKIVHYQEFPRLKEEFCYTNISKAVNAKIFVIDDGEQATMMLSNEY